MLKPNMTMLYLIDNNRTAYTSILLILGVPVEKHAGLFVGNMYEPRLVQACSHCAMLMQITSKNKCQKTSAYQHCSYQSVGSEWEFQSHRCLPKRTCGAALCWCCSNSISKKKWQWTDNTLSVCQCTNKPFNNLPPTGVDSIATEWFLSFTENSDRCRS